MLAWSTLRRSESGGLQNRAQYVVGMGWVYQIRLIGLWLGVWEWGRRRNYECRTTNVEWRRNGQHLLHSTFAIQSSPSPPPFLKQQLRCRIGYKTGEAGAWSCEPMKAPPQCSNFFSGFGGFFSGVSVNSAKIVNEEAAPGKRRHRFAAPPA